MADYLVPFSAFVGILKLGFASRGLGPLAGLCLLPFYLGLSSLHEMFGPTK